MAEKKIMWGNRFVSRYRIIYPKGKAIEQYLAEELSKQVFALTGDTLKVYADEDKVFDRYEFCIGQTNRTVEMPDGPNSYKVVFGDCGVEMVSNSPVGYEDAFKALLEKMTVEGDVELPIGTVLSGPVSHPAVRAKNDEYSFLFHNVWGYTIKWNPLSNRAELAKEIYRSYMPDIIGMQEVSGPHYEQAADLFAMLKKLGYEEIRFRHFGYGNPIYFNSRKVYPIECGYQSARIGGDKNHTWAVFNSCTENRTVFAVINSHFCADCNSDDGTPARGNVFRVADAAQLVKTVEMIQQRYPGLPVITGGDYNAFPNSDPIQTLFDGKMVWVRDLLPQAEPVSPYLCPKYIAEEDRYAYRADLKYPPAEHSIDYVMTYGPTKDSVEFRDYRVLTDLLSFLASDHNPHVLYAAFPGDQK